MLVDSRKLFSVSILPAIVLLCSYAFISVLSKPLPYAIQVTLPYLPFFIFFVGMIISWVFHHSREFNLLLLFAIIYISLKYYIWTPEGKIDTQLAHLLLVSLIPINYWLNLYLRERGIINRYGIRRFIILAVQLYIIALIIEYPLPIIKNIFTFSVFSQNLFSFTDISQLLVLALVSIGLLILFKLLQTPSTLLAGIFSSFIAITTAVHFYNQPQLAIIFTIIASILLILSIATNAYSLAYLDELTNLPSRRAMNQNISTLGKYYCIAMVDVDHFKKFNDQYGHDIGDQVLKKISSQLRHVRGGKAFRYGGEEFVLIFPNKNLHEARLSCTDLCSKIANNSFVLRSSKRPKEKQPDSIDNHEQNEDMLLRITVSIGVSERSIEDTSAKEVLKLADEALYRAKDNGRNQVAD